MVIPFSKVPIMELGRRIQEGERPDRPQSANGLDGEDCVWTIVTLCWDGNIDQRPPFSQTSTLLSLLQRSHPDLRRDISRSRQDLGPLEERLWKALINHANYLLL
jgi:hypothetical protein